MTKFLHSIFAVPFFYNQMQLFFGTNIKKKLVARHYPFLTQDAVVIDVGGGTGLYRDLWPKNYHYICLDNDQRKLGGFAKDHPRDLSMLADATCLPFKTRSVDAVFCSSLTHHLTEDLLQLLLSEGARVLKPSGRFILLDAVYRKDSFLNRFLWSLDRGEHPHTKDALMDCFERHFKVETSQDFSRYYDYVFVMGLKPATAQG